MCSCSFIQVDGDQKKVRGVEIVETMLRIIKDKLEIELCDEVYFDLSFSALKIKNLFKILLLGDGHSLVRHVECDR